MSVYNNYIVKVGDHLTHDHSKIERIEDVNFCNYGFLIVQAGAVFNAPNLVHTDGKFIIQPGAQVSAPKLVSVRNLQIIGVSLTLPALTVVEGALTVESGSVLDVPLLRSVYWEFHVKSTSTVRAPSLTKIHRELRVDPDCVLMGVGGIRYEPGEKKPTFIRRCLSTLLGTHSLCKNSSFCVERGIDRNIPSCKRKMSRFIK